MDDLISRQAALRTDCFGDGHEGLRAFHVYEDYKKMRDYIEALPSVQPEQTCEYWDGESKFCALCRPSAQPQRKTGKWIVHKSGWVCSECNEFVVSAIMGYPRYNFCPMCGAKMKGAGSEDIPMEYFESGGR